MAESNVHVTSEWIVHISTRKTKAIKKEMG